MDLVYKDREGLGLFVCYVLQQLEVWKHCSIVSTHAPHMRPNSCFHSISLHSFVVICLRQLAALR
jgi:hypothetical protein